MITSTDAKTLDKIQYLLKKNLNGIKIDKMTEENTICQKLSDTAKAVPERKI